MLNGTRYSQFFPGEIPAIDDENAAHHALVSPTLRLLLAELEKDIRALNKQLPDAQS
jgi:hypothetical protein